MWQETRISGHYAKQYEICFQGSENLELYIFRLELILIINIIVIYNIKNDYWMNIYIHS